MAGEVRIQTVVQLIKFGGYRQFRVPNPPLLVAAKRQAVKKLRFSHHLPEFHFNNYFTTHLFAIYR
ncbi:hypothetical protein BH09BAC5_BH09BAC5_22890 [soil metagenome]